MLRILTGVVVWLVLGWLVGRWLGSTPDPAFSPAGQVARFAVASPLRVRLRFQPPQIIRVGDPVFAGEAIEPAIGRIVGIPGGPSDRRQPVYTGEAEAELYPGWAEQLDVARPDELRLEWHTTPGSMGWVIQTMLPPEKRREISESILVALREHQPEIVSNLQPLVLESIRQSGEVIRADLARVIDAKKEPLSHLAARYQIQILQQEIVPLVSQVIWPIVQEEAWPLVNEIGNEIWREASVWRLSWRYIYDSLPFPDQNLTQREFQRIVDENVTPMIVSRLPEIYRVQARIIQRISSDTRVRETAARVMATVAQDRELQELGLEIMQEVLTNNPHLAEVWRTTWNTAEARQRLDVLNEKLEPTIVGIGELLFGNPRTEITPEFSRVLRHKVLFKDDGWLCVTRLPAGQSSADGDGGLKVVPAAVLREGPFHVPSRTRN